MKKLIVWTDLAEDMEDLSDAECGRLFKVMLKYAADDKEQFTVSGNERYLWRTQKRNIDAQWASYRKKCGSIENARTSNYRNQSEISNGTTEISMTSVQDNNNNQYKYHNQDKLNEEKKYTEAPSLDAMITEFIAYRKKECKKPMTDRAISMLKTRLEKLAPGDDGKKVELLQTAIYKGWLDVYEPDEEKKQPATNNPFLKILMEEGGAL